MRNLFAALLSVLVLGTALSAHVMVSPPQSKAGITQTYELRAHNESKLATTSLELQIPADITVLKVDQAPAGTVDTPKTGDRISAINWKVNIEPGKYLALKFEAKNPSGAAEIHWTVKQHMADGSTVDWSDAPGSKEKAPVTTISVATQ
jgi:uncharacterized protein YcnI